MDDPLSFIADVGALLTPEVVERVPILSGAKGRRGIHDALLGAVGDAPPRGSPAVSLITLVLRCAPASLQLYLIVFRNHLKPYPKNTKKSFKISFLH